MSRIDLNDERIVLPANSGLREAYVSILKSLYSDQKSEFWWHELINIVALDCSIDPVIAEKRCKQLTRIFILSFVRSTMSGHLYRVMVYSKKDKEVFHIDNWFKLNRLIETQFGDLVESELIQIGKKFRSKNTDEIERSMIESRLNLTTPIHEDNSRGIIEQREKITVEEVAEDFLRNLENTTSKNRNNHSENIADEIEVTSENMVFGENKADRK